MYVLRKLEEHGKRKDMDSMRVGVIKKILYTGLMSLLAAGIISGCASSQTEIVHLQTNHQDAPLGIDDSDVVFGWQMASEEQDKSQSAYRIVVADSESALKKEEYLWDSGKVVSGLAVAIPYEGPQLQTETRYYWNVEVWDEKDQKYRSEETATFETGFMGTFPEEAHWISVPAETDGAAGGDGVESADDIRDEMSVDPAVPYAEITEFSIDYEMSIQGTSACFAFGAEEGRYGCMTLCELRNEGEETSFTVKDMAQLSQNVDFQAAGVTTASDGIYHVSLSVKESEMAVEINGTDIGSFQIPTESLGAIGYYKSRGTDYADLDDIVVRDAYGNVCYEEDFEAQDSIFAPYDIATESGKCRVGSGLMLTGGPDDPAPVFRRAFQLEDQTVEKARLYMTALGSFEVKLDGKRVSDNFMDPGKLAYDQQLSYVTYDVTDVLQTGAEHSWETTLFHGWYDRGVGYPEIYNPWGDTNALRGVLVITYTDGTRQLVGTDGSFQVTTDGPIRENDVYQGEFYDATTDLENAHWMAVAVDAIDGRYDEVPLIGKPNESVTCVQELQPVSVSEPVEGVYVYDFGQNFAGVCRIRMNAQEGELVTLRYGEALNTENLLNMDDTVGTVWTENLLTADATDYYLATDGEQTYEPVSVYHGFRYLQITGLTEQPSLEDVTGLVLSSDLKTTGYFECSEELVNRYWSNAVWSQRSNFFDNPTDCAQRDERHGWAGDAQIFSGMACYNSDSYNFFRKYLTELRCLQSEDGAYPDMAPRNFGTGQDGSGGAGGNNCWGDAALVIAWNLYVQYGDVTVLNENYEAFCKWVDYLADHSENGLRPEDGGYGDHFSVEGTPKGLTDTAWSAHSAELLAKIAAILGKEDAAAHYREIYEQFKEAWVAEYVSADGVIECYSQTAYALGLAFDLFPEDMRQNAAECLLNNLVFNQYEFHAGYAGLNYVLPMLSEAGYSDAAYEVLCNTDPKSLLYPVTQGATTTPEYLLAYQEIDGMLQLDGSLNHYAYGAPAQWLYTNVLGIRSDVAEPGFKHFYIMPEINEVWSYAKGAYESPYGRIEVSWERQEDGGYAYQLTVPANTTATVILQGRDRMELGSGVYRFS